MKYAVLETNHPTTIKQVPDAEANKDFLIEEHFTVAHSYFSRHRPKAPEDAHGGSFKKKEILKMRIFSSPLETHLLGCQMDPGKTYNDDITPLTFIMRKRSKLWKKDCFIDDIPTNISHTPLLLLASRKESPRARQRCAIRMKTLRQIRLSWGHILSNLPGNSHSYLRHILKMRTWLI